MATVFISHRSSDSVAAERLAADIKAAGHSVWLDVWRIDVGDSIVARVQEGLEGALSGPVLFRRRPDPYCRLRGGARICFRCAERELARGAAALRGRLQPQQR